MKYIPQPTAPIGFPSPKGVMIDREWFDYLRQLSSDENIGAIQEEISAVNRRIDDLLGPDSPLVPSVGEIIGQDGVSAVGSLSSGFVTVSLSDVAQEVGGELLKVEVDNKGRIVKSESPTTDDLVEGLVNLYFPEAPEDGSIYGRKDAQWVNVASGGGGRVDTVVAGAGISVDSSDPVNPVVSSPLVAVGVVTPASGVATLDFQGGRRKHFTLSLTEDLTLQGSNFAPSGTATEFELRITNSGAFNLALPSWLAPLGGSDTSVAQGAGVITRLAAVTYDAGVSGDYAMQERN